MKTLKDTLRSKVVVSKLTDDQLKAATTEICGSYCFIESSLHQARVQRSNHLHLIILFDSICILLIVEFPPHLPGEFTEEKDEEDVASGDGDAGDQRHPGQASFNQTCLGFDKISRRNEKFHSSLSDSGLGVSSDKRTVTSPPQTLTNLGLSTKHHWR